MGNDFTGGRDPNMNCVIRAAACIIICAATGCNAVGPRTIVGARMNYNEAIARSWDEQLLLNLVRLKYRDSPYFLEVSSVSTQYSMTYGAGGSLSLIDATGGGTSLMLGRGSSPGATANRGGDRSRSRGLNASMSFVERPTVQYSPLQGQKFVTQLLSPIPLETVALLSRSGWSIGRILRLTMQEMNGVQNAPSASGPTPEYVPEFREFQELAATIRELQVTRAMDFGMVADNDEAFLAFRRRGGDKNDAALSRLSRLLGLPEQRDEFLFGPGFGHKTDHVLPAQTRSLLGVMYLLSQGVEVPERHRQEGKVTLTSHEDGTPFDWLEVTGDLIRIKSRKVPPDDAHVRIHYRGAWFYIEDTDLESKTTLGLLSYLFSIQSGEVRNLSPTLTLSLGN